MDGVSHPGVGVVPILNPYDSIMLELRTEARRRGRR